MPDVKVTTMAVKVDLKCEKCKKKVKKVLCKIPQIENQVYDEKNNQVIITVVCCSPEKIKQKIRCKGGDIIMGIEILKPPDKPPEKPATKPPEQAPKPSPKPPEQAPKSSPKPPEQAPKLPSPKPDPAPSAPPPPQPVPPYPPRDCCRECYEGYGWGPCYQGHGRPPPPCYDSYYGSYGRPVYDSWGSGCQRVYVSKCSDYICEENPTSCTII